MKSQETKNLKVADWVRDWQGGIGRVVGITPDGWYRVKEANSDRVDEWQGFQLKLMARMVNGRPEFYS